MSKRNLRSAVHNVDKRIPDQVVEKLFESIRTGKLDDIREITMKYHQKWNLISHIHKDEQGKTPVHVLLEVDDDIMKEPAKLEILHYLEMVGAPLDLPDSNNNWPIHIAASLQYRQIIIFLKSKNVNLERRDSSNNTPLHVSIYGRSAKCPPIKISYTTLNGQKHNVYQLATLKLAKLVKDKGLGHLDQKLLESISIVNDIPEMLEKSYVQKVQGDIIILFNNNVERENDIISMLNNIVSDVKDYILDTGKITFLKPLNIKAYNQGWGPTIKGRPPTDMEKILPFNEKDYFQNYKNNLNLDFQKKLQIILEDSNIFLVRISNLYVKELQEDHLNKLWDANERLKYYKITIVLLFHILRTHYLKILVWHRFNVYKLDELKNLSIQNLFDDIQKRGKVPNYKSLDDQFIRSMNKSNIDIKNYTSTIIPAVLGQNISTLDRKIEDLIAGLDNSWEAGLKIVEDLEENIKNMTWLAAIRKFNVRVQPTDKLDDLFQKFYDFEVNIKHQNPQNLKNLSVIEWDSHLDTLLEELKGNPNRITLVRLYTLALMYIRNEINQKIVEDLENKLQEKEFLEPLKEYHLYEIYIRFIKDDQALKNIYPDAISGDIEEWFWYYFNSKIKDPKFISLTEKIAKINEKAKWSIEISQFFKKNYSAVAKLTIDNYKFKDQTLQEAVDQYLKSINFMSDYSEILKNKLKKSPGIDFQALSSAKINDTEYIFNVYFYYYLKVLKYLIDNRSISNKLADVIYDIIHHINNRNYYYIFSLFIPAYIKLIVQQYLIFYNIYHLMIDFNTNVSKFFPVVDIYYDTNNDMFDLGNRFRDDIFRTIENVLERLKSIFKYINQYIQYVNNISSVHFYMNESEFFDRALDLIPDIPLNDFQSYSNLVLWLENLKMPIITYYTQQKLDKNIFNIIKGKITYRDIFYLDNNYHRNIYEGSDKFEPREGSFFMVSKKKSKKKYKIADIYLGNYRIGLIRIQDKNRPMAQKTGVRNIEIIDPIISQKRQQFIQNVLQYILAQNDQDAQDIYNLIDKIAHTQEVNNYIHLARIADQLFVGVLEYVLDLRLREMVYQTAYRIPRIGWPSNNPILEQFRYPSILKIILEEKFPEESHIIPPLEYPKHDKNVHYVYSLDIRKTGLFLSYCIYLDPKCAELLITPTTLNAQNSDGSTPLHIAVREHRAELVELLIQHGASMTLQDNLGRSPRDLLLLQLKNYIHETLGDSIQSSFEKIYHDYNNNLVDVVRTEIFSNQIPFRLTLAGPVLLAAYNHIWYLYLNNYHLGIDYKLRSQIIQIFQKYLPTELQVHPDDIYPTEMYRIEPSKLPEIFRESLKLKYHQEQADIIEKEIKMLNTRIESLYQEKAQRPGSVSQQELSALEQKLWLLEQRLKPHIVQIKNSQGMNSGLASAFQLILRDMNTRNLDLVQFYQLGLRYFINEELQNIWEVYLTGPIRKDLIFLLLQMVLSDIVDKSENLDKTSIEDLKIIGQFYQIMESTMMDSESSPLILEYNRMLSEEVELICYLCDLILTPVVLKLISQQIYLLFYEAHIPHNITMSLEQIEKELLQVKLEGLTLKEYLSIKLPKIILNDIYNIKIFPNEPKTKIEDIIIHYVQLGVNYPFRDTTLIPLDYQLFNKITTLYTKFVTINFILINNYKKYLLVISQLIKIMLLFHASRI